MVKAYLRYAHDAQFGIIASNACNVCCGRHAGNALYTGALEDVQEWDLRRGALVRAVRDASSLTIEA